MSDGIPVQRLDPEDSETLEEWVRVADEEDVLGVDVTRSDDEWPWQVFISAAEFVRADPLESDLFEGIESALRQVPGVVDVAHEDREVWIVKGDTTGPELVRACGSTLDRLAPRIRDEVEE